VGVPVWLPSLRHGSRVKTINYLSLDNDSLLRRHPLGGVAVELRNLWIVLCCHWWTSQTVHRGNSGAGVGHSRRPLILYTLLVLDHYLSALPGSALQDSEGEVRRPSLVTTWWVLCDYFRSEGGVVTLIVGSFACFVGVWMLLSFFGILWHGL
jgi:hypothetical protein